MKYYFLNLRLNLPCFKGCVIITLSYLYIFVNNIFNINKIIENLIEKKNTFSLLFVISGFSFDHFHFRLFDDAYLIEFFFSKLQINDQNSNL